MIDVQFVHCAFRCLKVILVSFINFGMTLILTFELTAGVSIEDCHSEMHCTTLMIDFSFQMLWNVNSFLIN